VGGVVGLSDCELVDQHFPVTEWVGSLLPRRPELSDGIAEMER
jgi:hypothetical protein